MRVLLASEHPKVSRLLGGVVEGESGAVIVGQAENVGRTLMLARKLRPDVAIIDCDLPHARGEENVPLSRAGGLDAAQIIAQEIPNTRVMLINNLDEMKLHEKRWKSDTVVTFARETIGNSIPLVLRDFSREPQEGPVFASVELRRQANIKEQVRDLSDEVVLFGGVGILCGLIMMLTVILFVPGVFAAGAGAVAVLAGFVGKAVARPFRKEKKENK